MRKLAKCVSKCRKTFFLARSTNSRIILLKETAEEFTLSLYEKLFELTSQNKSIDLDQLIEVSGVQIELCDVLENFKGDFNYSIKEPEIFDIETVHVKKISDGIKFFVLQKY